MQLVAVIGGSEATAAEGAIARKVGALLAQAGLGLVTGGRGGVMLEACRGAKENGGTTLALLPGDDPRQANEFVDLAIPTGMGEMRNALIVRSARALIAIGGGYGTLSEIGFALRAGKPIIGINTYEISRNGDPVEDLRTAETAEEAVEWVIEAIG